MIQEGLGHAAETMTQTYLDSFENIVVDGYDELIMDNISFFSMKGGYLTTSSSRQAPHSQVPETPLNYWKVECFLSRAH